MEILLSIIIPYYKTLQETKELFKILEPQLNDKVEVLLIDDGCNEKELDNFKAKVIHLEKNSGNASKPRNIGLDKAKGKYIAFIDSDDLVSFDYIEEIMKHLKYDIIFLSWKSYKHNVIIYGEPPKWNCSVWSRVYKKEIIGKTRFREDLKIAEDWAFNQEIKYKTSYAIKKQIYFYNCKREGSLTRR